jgi:hypothetical protein
MSKKKYTLKAMLPSENSIATANEQRFNRITPSYILLYTDKAVIGAQEFPKEGYRLLTQDDALWLQDCVTLVNMERGIADQKKIEANNKEFMKRFEEELQIEQDKLNRKAVNENGERDKGEADS